MLQLACSTGSYQVPLVNSIVARTYILHFKTAINQSSPIHPGTLSAYHSSLSLSSPSQPTSPLLYLALNHFVRINHLRHNDYRPFHV